MKIEVNVEKRYAFLIIGILILITGGIVVYATHTESGNPGHSINSITGIPTCSAGQVLTHTSAGIVCVTDATGGGGSSSGIIVGWGFHHGITGNCLESTGTCLACVPNTAQGSLATCDGFNRFNCPSGSDKFRVSTEPSATVGATRFNFICIKD